MIYIVNVREVKTIHAFFFDKVWTKLFSRSRLFDRNGCCGWSLNMYDIEYIYWVIT